MGQWRDLLAITVQSLRARVLRSLFMAVGAAVGVGVVVGAQGTLLSAKGDLRASLDELGTNLLVIRAGEGSTPQIPRLPANVSQRVSGITTVESVAWTAAVDQVPAVLPRVAGHDLGQVSARVLIASPEILEVLRLDLAAGRFLTEADDGSALTAAVIGPAVAGALGIDNAAEHSLEIAGVDFAIVGILAPSELAPELDSSVIIPASTADRRFGSAATPTTLYVRTEPSQVVETAAVLPLAIGYGGPDARPTVSVATELLQARATVDRNQQAVLFGVGALALLVGSFGVVNTLHIALLERRSEVGLRRALGQQRGVVGAQFVLEAGLIGAAGAVLGAAAATSFVVVLAERREWVVQLDIPLTLAAVGAATVISAGAGLGVARKAARLDPLDALRTE